MKKHNKRFTELKVNDIVLGLRHLEVNPILYIVISIEIKENDVYLTLLNKFTDETIKFYGFGLEPRMFYDNMWLFCDYDTYMCEMQQLEKHLELAKIIGTLLKNEEF